MTLTLANDRNGAGLRAFLSRLFHKSDLSAHSHSVESPVQYAVSVEIDLMAIRRFKKAISLVRKQLAHAGMGHGLMKLYGTAYPPLVVLQLSAGRIKRIPDRDVNILMGLAFDDNLGALGGNVDPYQIA